MTTSEHFVPNDGLPEKFVEPGVYQFTEDEEVPGEDSLDTFNFAPPTDQSFGDGSVTVTVKADFQLPTSIEGAVESSIIDDEQPCIPYYPPFQQGVQTGDTGDFDVLGSTHISQMHLCTKAEATEIAQLVLAVLDEDVDNYFKIKDDMTVIPKRRFPTESSLSVDSNYSNLLPGDASTMNLFYEFEPSSIVRHSYDLPTEDVGTEVNFHRQGPTRPKMRDAWTITHVMTFVDELTAELVFRHCYPLKDDYVPPPIPSRNASLAEVITQVKEADKTIDKVKVGPKIYWSRQLRLLPPLPQNYFKEETFWTGSVFKGQYVNRQFAHGRFEYPLMSVYESEFKEGHMSTQKHLGCVTYPRGDKFEGEWVNGRHVTGQITFADELKFEQHNWNYLGSQDRRFYIEKDIGMKQVGKTLFNDRFPPPYIPPGDYDTGYGIFNPDTGVVRAYTGEKLRDASYAECKWILSACRKVKKLDERYMPKFDPSRLPGSAVEKYVKQEC